MKTRPIHYEPHPVSRERKAELVAQGFAIIDIKFMPKQAAEAAAAAEAAPARAARQGRKQKVKA